MCQSYTCSSQYSQWNYQSFQSPGYRLAEPGQALAEALALAQRVAEGPANAGARIKRLCQNAGAATLEEQLDLEAELMAESQGDDEAQEGIAAFFARRAPDFAALRAGGARREQE